MDSSFSKQDSLVSKGVAILLMLYLHLFNQMNNVLLCHNNVYIEDIPLIHILVRATNPVPFFLILSGYGMYIVYKKGDKHRYSRLLKLLLHYWVILLIFVGIGSFLYPDRYPGTWSKILSNVTGYKTTYNGECWFLLPYVLLSFTSPWVFKVTDRYKDGIVVPILFLINLSTSFFISRYGERFLFHNYWAYIPILYFNLMLSFYLGSMSVKHDVFQKVSSKIRPYGKYLWILLLLLVLLRCCYNTYSFDEFYAYPFLLLFVNAPRLKIIDRCLALLGNHSMNMWMIHSWFCYYLFHDYIYELKYPIAIYIVLILISLVSSYIINFICHPVEKIVNKI